MKRRECRWEKHGERSRKADADEAHDEEDGAGREKRK